MNVAGEVVAEELLPYNEFFLLLVVPGKGLVATTTYILFLCFLQLPILLQTNYYLSAKQYHKFFVLT